MSKEKIDQYLDQAFAHAQDDHHKKLLLDSKLKAKNLINNVKKSLEQNSHLISTEYYSKIMNVIDTLQNRNNRDNRDEIEKYYNKLNEVSADFMIKHFNSVATKALEGKNIKDFR